MKKQTNRITAIYVRVSSSKQSTRSQLPDLKRWVEAQPKQHPAVKWYVDKASGKTMDRPKWNKLQAAIDNNQISRLV
ncbi:unnamed protein product, partial [marine sediment metagenome]